MKRNALLLMGFFMAMVVAVVFVACGGGNSSSQKQLSGQAAKIVGKWKCNDVYYGEAMIITFNRDNTGFIKRSGYYGVDELSLSYNYDNDFDELKLAVNDDYYGYYGYSYSYYGYGYDNFQTMKVEWFGEDRFYLVDKYYGYYKIGPFVRQ